jgi:hypothetical protein
LVTAHSTPASISSKNISDTNSTIFLLFFFAACCGGALFLGFFLTFAFLFGAPAALRGIRSS